MVATRTPPAARPSGDRSGRPPPQTPHFPHRGALTIAALVTASVVVFLVTAGGGGGGGSGGRDGFAEDVYTVRTGDTISFVADLHAVSEESLMEENDLTRSDALRVGDQLVIPPPPTEGREPPDVLQSHPTKPQLEPVFERWSEEYGVPPALIEALAWVQSSWTAGAEIVGTEDEEDSQEGEESSDEGIGIGRLAPETAGFVNNRVLGGERLNLADPEDGIQLMTAYLGFLLEANDGSWAAAVSAYRGGLQGPREGAWDLNRVDQITEVLELVPDFQVTLASLGIETTTSTTEGT